MTRRHFLLLRDDCTKTKLAFFALIQPEGDIFPVRTVYGDGQTVDQTNIGLNPLTSNAPVWSAGPDVVGSALTTGRPPKILRAIRIEPIGVQKGMKSVTLGTGSIDPYTDDFFRKVIEERKGKQKSDPLYYFLKILANAGCYGIYAEVNKLQVGHFHDTSSFSPAQFSRKDPDFLCLVLTPSNLAGGENRTGWNMHPCTSPMGSCLVGMFKPRIREQR
jgi:hypothetical protein